MSKVPPEPSLGNDEAERHEFATLVETAGELGLDPAHVPAVARHFIDLPDANDTWPRRLSALVWGDDEPELVLLHGGGQNAHTWDLVLLLLGRSAVAIDLPGHGHSSWRDDRDYGPIRNATAVAAVIEALAPHANAVIGMSLGGLTTIHLAATRPDLVRRAVLVDVTPGTVHADATMTATQRGAVQLTRGPRSFANRQQMIDAAVRASPGRLASAVRRGVVHNSRKLPDGTWTWRYDAPDPALPYPVSELWDDVSRLTMATLLVAGGESAFVSSADKAELSRRLPSIRIETVPGAGHAVQSDKPAALAAIITAAVPPRRRG